MVTDVSEENAAFIFSPDKRGRIFLRNVCISLQDHTVSQKENENLQLAAFG
jgi:hypothetical protein